MKALVYYERAEEAVEIRDVPIPEIGPNDYLVKVKYCGICRSDINMYHGRHNAHSRPPVILGHEWSGEIVQAGERASGFAIGDRVVAESAAQTCGTCVYCRSGEQSFCPERLSCGFAIDGAFTSHIRVRDRLLHHIPEGVSFEAAALGEPLCVTYRAVVEKSHIRIGDTVVVIGPGPIGLFAVQLARMAGAGALIVTGTKGDGMRLAVAAQLGADIAADVSKEDPGRLVREVGDGLGAHLVIDAAGPPPAIKQSLALVRRSGQVTKIGWCLEPVDATLDTVVAKAITYQGVVSHTWKTWEACLRLMGQGRIQTEPLISEIWPLSRWKEAFARLEALEAVKILLYPED